MPTDETQFCLKIDFERGLENPSRVFQAMAGLIAACEATDRTLLRTITPRLRPVLLLDDIETGSLVSILREAVEGIDDEALKSGDVKKVIGTYLVKGKHRLVKWLKEREGISNRDELVALESDLHQLAEATEVKMLSFYEPVSMPKLVENMEQFEEALSLLKKEDRAYYISEDLPEELNKNFHIDADAVQTLLTEKTLSNTIEAYLKIKKPDYLGQSMWEMVYDDRTIDVKILHAEWLSDFQSRRVDVRPGDALFVDLRIVVRYGYDGLIISSHYEAIAVKGIKSWVPSKQPPLFLEGE